MEVNFTKGPWKTTPTENAHIIENSTTRNTKYIADVHLWSNKDSNDEESVANANLIAAAPEMYEALLSVFNGRDETSDETNYLVEKAIAKAEGK